MASWARMAGTQRVRQAPAARRGRPTQAGAHVQIMGTPGVCAGAPSPAPSLSDT
eukprot:CAMPEP_0174356174 /NCGR_PEP_ID=MMETSP0811_2-20130205/29271_1 /TAXON_ID=73025 ORGANISM="Eutreptiella gymnastica-like, Strain CCMP1594" /NCGR_SAMPLE_ID=MMETSP0811_2 /ASSEMBLY_ACC=CAM_ASM_000667 /LENGTH=53 /DNA_ID=CAMNT_0015488061 /DNA_START=436 /DNA_END=593 /DNA_ORIENTATION=+